MADASKPSDPSGRRTLNPIDEARARVALRYRRARGLAPPPPGIGDLATRLARNVLPEKANSLDALKARWVEVVGPRLAKMCAPEKASSGKGGRTLTLRVLPAAAPLVQHQSRDLIQKIELAGCGKFAAIKLSQGPLPGTGGVAPAKRRRALTADELAWLEDSVRPIEDPALRAATMALGKAVLSAEPPAGARRGGAR